MPVIDYKAEREAYEDQHYTKLIDCPENAGKHQATLFCEGHRYAGIWECPITGASDTHEHIDYEIEDVEVDDSHPDRSDGYTYQVYVCGGPNGCGVAIDLDVASPAEDAADAETVIIEATDEHH